MTEIAPMNIPKNPNGTTLLRLFWAPIATWHFEARGREHASSISTAGGHQSVIRPLAILATWALESVFDGLLGQF